MNQDAYQRIVALTPMIQEFSNLEPSERAWLKPMMTKTALTAVAILDLLSSRQMTYEELADDMGLNWQTCKQICNALADGGAKIQVSGKVAIAETGRLRVLKRVV